MSALQHLVLTVSHHFYNYKTYPRAESRQIFSFSNVWYPLKDKIYYFYNFPLLTGRWSARVAASPPSHSFSAGCSGSCLPQVPLHCFQRHLVFAEHSGVSEVALLSVCKVFFQHRWITQHLKGLWWSRRITLQALHPSTLADWAPQHTGKHRLSTRELVGIF